MVSKKFYVTTAIDYTNAPPHIGHAFEKVQADVLARWARLNGKDTFFLTGTDEHGAKIEEAAKAAGQRPEVFASNMSGEFEDAWKTMDLSFDRFIHTTDPDHVAAVIEMVKRFNKKGDIYKGKYEGLYCVSCEKFFTETESERGCCPVHKKPLKKVSEETYFFRLSKYQKKLLDFYKKNPEFIRPRGKANEIINRVSEGLKDLSVTRTSVKWGIPFPLDEKHTTYVWIDALTNYLTGVGWPDKKYGRYWPADVHMVGKDISWFHTVIWPAMLFSAGIKPPKSVFVHGYISLNGEKISKSLGNVIDPRTLVNKYGADTVRYFLLRDIPSAEDGDFSEAALVQKHNTDLADGLGNLVNRAVVMAFKYSDGKVPKPSAKWAKSGTKLKKAAAATVKSVGRHLGDFHFSDALGDVWLLIAEANKYINDEKPWEINDKDYRGTVLYNSLEAVRLVATLVSPFMPATSAKIFAQLGSGSGLKWGGLKHGTQLKQADVLFKKIEADKVGKKNEGGNYVKFDDWAKLDLRVAKVKKVEDIAGADKLYKLSVDVGGEERTIVAGMKKHYGKEELIGKEIIVVANLEPAKIKGVESRGMLLAASDGEKVVLLTPDKTVKSGSKIS